MDVRVGESMPLGVGETSEIEWACLERSGVASLLTLLRSIEGRRRVGTGSEEGAPFDFDDPGVDRPRETEETRCANFRKGDIERDIESADVDQLFPL